MHGRQEVRRPVGSPGHAKAWGRETTLGRRTQKLRRCLLLWVPSPRMSSFSIRARLSSSRHPLVALVLVLVLSGALAVHHGAPMAMHTAGEVCLAVCAGAVLLARRRVACVPARHPRPLRLRPVSRPLPTAPEPRARAGPILLQVMRL